MESMLNYRYNCLGSANCIHLKGPVIYLFPNFSQVIVESAEPAEPAEPPVHRDWKLKNADIAPAPAEEFEEVVADWSKALWRN